MCMYLREGVHDIEGGMYLIGGRLVYSLLD